MEHSIEIPLLLQTKNDEIEEGRKMDHFIEIKVIKGQDRSRLQTNKLTNQIFDKMLKKLDNSSFKSCTIFKVNMWLRESNPSAYTPKMVSIGPYHMKNPQLRSMEMYKLLYLRRFLQRKEGLDVECCISQLESLKDKALKCYHELEDFYSDNNTDQFLEMLLLDGCFVIEFLRECYGMCPSGEDIIINVGCINEQVRRDLFLLENQLPFFVLDKLHHMTKQVDEFPLSELMSELFSTFFTNLPKMIPTSFGETESNAGNIKHLLHIVHIISCHGNSLKNSKDDITWEQHVMPNARELSEAGVSFAKVKNNINRSLNKDNIGNLTSLFDIKFENGLMTIPCFEVVDNTETLLRNLVAYEQQSYDVRPKYFSDYTTFMDFLIESHEDVSLLRRTGIIENWLGEDKEVACIFNKIGQGVAVYPDFYYRKECNKLIKHCEKPWNQMKANLMHNYFNSPWAGASTVGAIILLILTVIQIVRTFK